MRLGSAKARLWTGLSTLGAAACAVAWIASGDPAASAREAAIQRGCMLLAAGRAGDWAAFDRARQAFRAGVGGPFADRIAYFGGWLTDELERAARGVTPADAAVAALARGDFDIAERLFRERGGVVARHGTRLVRALSSAHAVAPGAP